MARVLGVHQAAWSSVVDERQWLDELARDFAVDCYAAIRRMVHLSGGDDFYQLGSLRRHFTSVLLWLDPFMAAFHKDETAHRSGVERDRAREFSLIISIAEVDLGIKIVDIGLDVDLFHLSLRQEEAAERHCVWEAYSLGRMVITVEGDETSARGSIEGPAMMQLELWSQEQDLKTNRWLATLWHAEDAISSREAMYRGYVVGREERHWRMLMIDCRQAFDEVLVASLMTNNNSSSQVNRRRSTTAELFFQGDIHQCYARDRETGEGDMELEQRCSTPPIVLFEWIDEEHFPMSLRDELEDVRQLEADLRDEQLFEAVEELDGLHCLEAEERQQVWLRSAMVSRSMSSAEYSSRRSSPRVPTYLPSPPSRPERDPNRHLPAHVRSKLRAGARQPTLRPCSTIAIPPTPDGDAMAKFRRMGDLFGAVYEYDRYLDGDQPAGLFVSSTPMPPSYPAELGHTYTRADASSRLSAYGIDT